MKACHGLTPASKYHTAAWKRANRDGEGIDDPGEEVVLAIQAKQDQRGDCFQVR